MYPRPWLLSIANTLDGGTWLCDGPRMTYSRCPICAGSGKVLDRKTAATELRALRYQAGMTQEELATILGVSARYISDIECGQRALSHRLEHEARKHLGGE